MSDRRPDLHLVSDGGDEQRLESVLGPQIVARLHALLRAMRLYELSNNAVRQLVHEALAPVEAAMEDEVVLVAMGQCFYVNGVRVRAEQSQVPLFSALSAEFEQRRLGGVRLLAGLTAEELGTFVRLLAEHADPARAATLGEAAAGAGVVHAVPITLEELKHARDAWAQAPAQEAASERARARLVFDQAVNGARAVHVRTARTGRPAVRRAKRAVQPIVDAIMKNEFSIVGLTAIKHHDEYTYAHSVNVSILAIAMGQMLGFSRATLASLGVAALLHDVGKLTIPPEVLGKPGRLDEDEWAQLRRHPLEGSKTAMRMPGFSPLLLDALHVTLFHHRRLDGGGYPRVERTGPPPVLARVVAVADCFDAMTTHRSYRERPFTGHEALAIMLGEERTAFDPAVLWALVQSVGLYPAGTLIHTRSGHVVLSLNNDREDLRRPVCRVIARPDGTSVVDGPPEIWDPMPRHESVARVIAPDEFDTEIDRLLAA